MRNTDPFRDARCVMRQRVEVCSHHRYVDDVDDEEECNVDIGGKSVEDYAIVTVRSRRSMTLE